jgi:WD40 repeat protein
MTDRVGQQIGNYRLTRLLGEGGFAEVYLGEHLYLGSQAAIKLLHTHVAQRDIAHFQQEGRMLANLIHPHIVRILDFGVDDHIPYLIMDYAPGGTLRTRHPRGTRLPLLTVVQYVKQIGQALQYAHDQKFIHRDIKPENMLIGRNGDILLSDFGIALIAQSSRYQSAKDMAGTIAYMAPEQIEAHPRSASDQYALGIVLYEWLSGERPFRGSFTEIAIKQSLTLPSSLVEYLPSLPPAVEQVIFTALAKKSEERFASIRSFVTALEQASTIEPLLPPIISVLPQPTKQLPPHAEERATSKNQEGLQVLLDAPNIEPSVLVIPSPSSSSPMDAPNIEPSALVVPSPSSSSPISLNGTNVTTKVSSSSPQRFSRRSLVAGLTALVVAGGGVVWWTSTYVTPIGTHLYTYTGHSYNVNAVAWSPDGKRIASGSYDTTVQVWNAADGSQPYTYTGHSHSVNAVAWSPDGKRIASGGSDMTVQVWNAVDGSQPYTYQGHANSVLAVAWSPDGKRIASGSYDMTVQVWNAVDGSQPYTYHGHTNSVNAVTWSPDGKRIASGSYDNTVQVWNAADGSQPYTYHGHTNSVLAVAWSPDGKQIASGSGDMTVQVWNVADGSRSYTYHGHSSSVFVVAWSPDGKRIASGSNDNTVQVWNAADGSQPYTYQGHSSSVFVVAWSPDGKRIASGSYDTTVQVWAS